MAENDDGLPDMSHSSTVSGLHVLLINLATNNTVAQSVRTSLGRTVFLSVESEIEHEHIDWNYSRLSAEH